MTHHRKTYTPCLHSHRRKANMHFFHFKKLAKTLIIYQHNYIRGMQKKFNTISYNKVFRLILILIIKY